MKSKKVTKKALLIDSTAKLLLVQVKMLLDKSII